MINSRIEEVSEKLRPEEYQSLYEIGRVIIQVLDSETALKEIFRLARPAFIFDNIVLYEFQEDQKLFPTYARSIGRGRHIEADMEWGETIARDVIQSAKMVVQGDMFSSDSSADVDQRLNQRDFLGLPLQVGKQVTKALVFIRFGGPPYLPEQIRFAKLIAEHVEKLLERQELVGRVAKLEAERRLDRLQEQFVATVSHELRSPLGFIKGYATSLLRDDAEWDYETRREFLMIIDEESDRLTEIIDNILDSSRLQAGILPMEFQVVRLAKLLNDFVQRMQARNINLDFQINLNDSSKTIEADPARLVQVLNNLVNNAAKYAPNSEVSLSLSWAEERVRIEVRDTGPGVPAKHVKDIFKRFYRLDAHQNKASGTGLGLYICRQIVQAHGGEIFAESDIGKGMVVHICLPINRSIENLEEEL
ncbi:MAG: hypothetical protein ISR58_16735 [Anaerolineales bacterium]|nr:hypothetical protein [Chloroflexota bacterium]MBL6982821.1 hypothetical protein [Anaerolineales bacterium]